MNQFFQEYGGMILASAGAFLILLVFHRILLSPAGEFAQMILRLAEGGI